MSVDNYAESDQRSAKSVGASRRHCGVPGGRSTDVLRIRYDWPLQGPQRLRLLRFWSQQPQDCFPDGLRWKPRWAPRWRVMRNRDADPGQNAGSAVRVPAGLDAGPALLLCKARCEGRGLGGFVLGAGGGARSGAAYFREAEAAKLREVAVELQGAWLCLLPAPAGADTTKEPPSNTAAGATRRIVLLASHDEFDETCYTDPSVDVSTAGNGRKRATQAMLRCLLEEASEAGSLELVAVLVLDFQAESAGEGSPLVAARPLPAEGPERLQVGVPGFGQVPAYRGDLEQLLVAGAGELEADVAIATSPRRDMLTVLHGAVKATAYAAMGHDYNLPYGPWGTREAAPSAHERHCQLLQQTTIFCTSRHLADYLKHWSSGKVATRTCYCADYGYFDDDLNCEPIDVDEHQSENNGATSHDSADAGSPGMSSGSVQPAVASGTSSTVDPSLDGKAQQGKEVGSSGAEDSLATSSVADQCRPKLAKKTSNKISLRHAAPDTGQESLDVTRDEPGSRVSMPVTGKNKISCNGRTSDDSTLRSGDTCTQKEKEKETSGDTRSTGSQDVPAPLGLSLGAGGAVVTFISPCPAKGLCLFLRVAKETPSAKFLAVSTLWTKSIHEQQLRQLPNVEIIPGSADVDAIYRRTSILIVPSIWSEAFGLVVVEAQLRGIPVVSTDAYGLKEANMIDELRVPNVPLVQDLKIRTLHRGKPIDQLESILPHARKEPGNTEEERSRNAAQAHLYVASRDEVHALLRDPKRRAKLGLEARERAQSFVRSRQGSFLKLLAELA
eukprot:TRINITY_DN22975_c0_g2_i4.p1 TRINITY_DN22975_c0_g2~~TRINITY_DN22975_c0_g2_i4.p1  ORF type:complete len:784 (-),score=149.50 TRINITY_DN22975_c0_g2_i4:50-2401(-)